MAENKLNFIFGADISEFQQGLNKVTDGLKNIGNQMKDFGSTMSTYVSLPLVALGAASIKAFGDIQSLKNGLTAITGSADEANKQFVRLKELAKLPGLGLKEVTKGSISLQVIGFTAEKAEKSIKAFGNAVATVGGGRDQFERATYGLAQLANTDFPLGEDLNIIKDAIPQVTPLLKEAFGSARSDELKEMGVSSTMVVDAIVNGLSKLPPVTGGINAAFENLKDGVFSSLAEVGEVINKHLDISALADRIVAGLAGITDWFKNLSPEVQKAVLIFGGLLIVIPPIIAALGVFISTILPALITGFGALLSPVTAIVVAVAAAAYLIIDNWSEIKEYFVSGEGSTFWNVVKSYAEDLWNSLKSMFNTVKAFILQVWAVIGTNVIGYVKGAFDMVKGIISTALGVVTGVIKIFASVLKGDWSGVWDGIKTITASMWNGILQIIRGATNAVGNGVAAFFKMIGADGLAKKVENQLGVINVVFDAIQIPIKKATETVKDFNKEVAKAADGNIATTVTTKNKTAGNKDQEKKIAQVYKDLAIGLKQIEVQFGATFGDKAKKRIDEYQQAIDGLIKNGVNPLSDAIKKLQAEQQRQVRLEAPKITAKATDALPKQKPVTVDFSGVNRGLVTGLTEQKAKVITLMQEMNDGITQSINSSVANMAGGFVEMLGAMASGTMGMGDVAKGLISMLGDMAVQVGKIAISTGIAMLGIKKAFSNPFTAIAAGIALVALGGLVKGRLAKATGGDGGGRTAFAKGGIVSSPTNAIFGEYPSAGRGNPEVVAPLNSLKSMLGDIGGSGGQVVFEIQGDKLYGVLNNYDKRQNRTR